MNTNVKKGLLIFTGGLIFFLIVKKLKPIGIKKSKKSSSSKPVITEQQRQNAGIAIAAYQAALKAGEPVEFLDEMNVEFAKLYKLKVFTDKGTGKLFAATLEGEKIV